MESASESTCVAELGNVRLGWEYKDIVTGFIGVAVAWTHWLHGCTRVVIQPSVDKDGKMPSSQTIDEPQLQLYAKIGEGVDPRGDVVIQKTDKVKKSQYGDRPNTAQAPDAVR